MSSLRQSPFYVLGASTRDDRRKIVALAEEKGLLLESDVCAKARSDLTTPRTRLGTEMGWLPGVSPKRAGTLVDALHTNIGLLKGQTSISSLANANLLSAAFEMLDPSMDEESWCEWIVDLAYAADAIKSEDVLREINEDRSVSGFPEVKGIEQIEIELGERRRHYTEAIRTALNGFELMKLVKVVTDVVTKTTSAGEKHAPQLVHELVDRYEMEARRYLQPEAENIKKLIDAIKVAAESSEATARPLVERLIQMAHKWHAIAQPIQLSMKAQGIEHDLSHDVAWAMRSLAVDLFNMHDLLNIATRLNKTLKELFAELPAVVERLDQDSEALDDIARKRDQDKLLDPIRALCEKAVKAVDANSDVAEREGLQVLREGKILISTIQGKAAPDIVLEARNHVAATVMRCSIEYGNSTAKWGACVGLLNQSLELAADKKLRQQIEANLVTARGNERQFAGLEPIKSAPSLSTINGVGFTLYGNADRDAASGSYLSTYYFVFFFIPIFPIARYRVIATPGGYQFLGKAPLRTMDIWHIVISVAAIIWMFAK